MDREDEGQYLDAEYGTEPQLDVDPAVTGHVVGSTPTRSTYKRCKLGFGKMLQITVPEYDPLLSTQDSGLGKYNVLLAYRGSIAHGMYIPNTDPNSVDDVDLIGIVIPPIEYYYGLSTYANDGSKEIKQDKWDIVLYEIRKTVRMLKSGNPNILSLLWTDPAHFISVSQEGQWLVQNRSLFLTNEIHRSFYGYAMGQMHKMEHGATNGFMGAKRKALVEKFGYDCYDCETTEFLTSTGWKKFDEIASDDCLATVKIRSGEIEYQKPIGRIDKLYSGMMYIIDLHSSRCFVTENHNLLVSDTHRSRANGFKTDYVDSAANWHLKSVLQVVSGKRHSYHIRRAPDARTVDFPISDDFIILSAFYISEGTTNFRDNKVKSIRFTQKKQGIFHQIADSLMSVFPIRKYVYSKESVWILHGDDARKLYSMFGHGSKEKHLAEWCFNLSKRQVDLFWYHLCLGDGTFKKENQIYYTSSKNLADDLQASLVSAGESATVYGPFYSNSTYGTNTSYHVARSNTEGRFHTMKAKVILKHGETRKSGKYGFPIKEVLVKDRRVVCFEVSNGTLITRNSGKVAIHGNCKNAAHLIRLLRMCCEAMETGELFVNRSGIDSKELLEIKTGSFELADVKLLARGLFARMELARKSSKLPNKPDDQKINDMLVEIVKSRLQYYAVAGVE